MPVTTLDPITALIVIDLQKGIAALTTAHPAAAVIANARALAGAFRARGLPVVLVNVDGGAPGRVEQIRHPGARPADWSELVPELDPQPGDLRITKRTWGAFSHTGQEARLRAAGATQVVVAGISTSAGVESTARQAHECGFNVTLATDAMTDLDPEAHRHSVARIFPRIGETGTTGEILQLLAGPGAG